MFRIMIPFYGEELLAPHPIHKLEGHPLSKVRDCFIQYIRSYLPYWRPFFHQQSEDTSCRGTREPLITAKM